MVIYKYYFIMISDVFAIPGFLEMASGKDFVLEESVGSGGFSSVTKCKLLSDGFKSRSGSDVAVIKVFNSKLFSHYNNLRQNHRKGI